MGTRWLSIALPLGLVAAGLTAPAAATSPSTDGPLERPDRSAAVTLARQAGAPVEVTGLRTESTETAANPDGTFTYRSYAGAVRVRRGNGWAAIDTSLRRNADGSVSPVASISDVRFSGGGNGPVVTLAKAGRWLSLSWPAPLPAPRIAGDTATYPEVLPGVDLHLRAEADGFAELLVVKDRAAALNPALRALRFGTSTRGLTLRDQGGGSIAAVDAAGVPVYVSPGSYMWDSSGPAGRAGARAVAGEDAHPLLRQARMPVSIGAGVLTVTPDLAMLTDPGTAFPLFIDPPFTGWDDNWTHVNSASPNTSYWGSNRGNMRVGRRFNTSEKWRTFVRINTDGIVGTQVVSAQFFTKLDHTANCQNSPIELWTTGYVQPNNTTWNNTVNTHWLGHLGTLWAHANESGTPVSQGGCGAVQPDVLLKWDNVDVRDAAQLMANGQYRAFGLKTPNEGDKYQWKYLYPANSSSTSEKTYLSVTYNRRPDTPVLRPLSDCYLACGSPGVVRSTEPALSVGVSDVDNPSGAVLKTWFEVYDAARTTLLAANAAPVMATSGGAPFWRVPPGVLADDTTYHWKATVTDELGFGSGESWGGFTVDTSPPVLAVVTSPNYPENQTGPVEGTTASFTFGPGAATDVVEYWWWIDGHVAPTKVTGTNPTVTWVTRGVVHNLKVYAVDRAGNTGPTKTYQFGVTPAPNRFSEWRLDEATGTTAADTGRNLVTPLPGTLSQGVSWVAGRVNNGASFTGSGTITTASGALDTTRSFSVAAWVRVDADALSSGNLTIASQDGAKQSMFRLQYRSDSRQWCFSLRAGDDYAASLPRACSAVTLPEAGVWVHLVGVYSAADAKIYLYVNGGPEGDGSTPDTGSTFTAPWLATGPFVLGRALAGADNQPGEFWRGAIDEVVAAQRILSGPEIWTLALGGRLS